MNIEKHIDFSSNEMVLVEKGELKEIIHKLYGLVDQVNELGRGQSDREAVIYRAGQLAASGERTLDKLIRDRCSEHSELKKTYDEIEDELEELIEEKIKSNETPSENSSNYIG